MRRSFLLVSSFLLFLAKPLLCAAVPAWPTVPRPTFSVEKKSEMGDGFLVEWLSLESSSLSLKWMPLEPWYNVPKAGSGVSITFGHRMVEGLQMNLIYYPEGAWFGDLSDQSIEAYVNSLGKQFPKASISLLNADALKPPTGSVPFLGGPFRQVHFNVTPDDANEPQATFYDYIAATEGALLVVRYKGSAETLERMETRLIRELFYFEVQ